MQGSPGGLDGVEVADHLRGDSHPAGGGDTSVGVDGVTGVVGGEGHHRHVVLDQHGGLNRAMTEAVERVVVWVEAGCGDTFLEEILEILLFQSHEGSRVFGGDPEDWGVGAARLGAVHADQGVECADRAPVGVGGRGERDGLEALTILDGLGVTEGED